MFDRCCSPDRAPESPEAPGHCLVRRLASSKLCHCGHSSGGFLHNSHAGRAFLPFYLADRLCFTIAAIFASSSSTHRVTFETAWCGS